MSPETQRLYDEVHDLQMKLRERIYSDSGRTPKLKMKLSFLKFFISPLVTAAVNAIKNSALKLSRSNNSPGLNEADFEKLVELIRKAKDLKGGSLSGLEKSAWVTEQVRSMWGKVLPGLAWVPDALTQLAYAAAQRKGVV